MVWKFGLTTLDGTPIGEITKASERKLTLPLNGLPTASFEMRLDDPLANEILSRDGDVLLKIFQGSTLVFLGDLMTAEEVGTDSSLTLACNFAGPLWRLSKKLIGSSPLGTTSSFENLAADQVVKGILDQANLDDPGSPGMPRATKIRWGTSPTLYATTVGLEPSWALKPVSEAITELQAAKVDFPITTPPLYSARDDFTSAGDGPLHTRLATDATAWDTNDTAVTDFDVVDAGNYAHRAAAGDPSYAAGKWAVSGTGNHGAVVVGVDYQIGTASYASGYSYYTGVFARYIDQNNWLLALMDLQSNSVILRKNVAGVGVNTAWESYVFSSGGVVHSTRYAIRLLVDDAGNYGVFHYAPPDGPGAPVIEGRDPALASGGALASGKVGFYDALTTGVGFDRNYYTFFAGAYTGPQSFDFEVAPLNIGVSGETDIGALNLAHQIGSVRPEAIFEYGTGGRSVKSYRRLIDRQGMVNHAYVLDPNGGSDIRGSNDNTSITARGEFQEVIPSDFGNSQLRQALAEAHVTARKNPRQLITFEPSTTAPQFGTDYIVGDYITGRIARDTATARPAVIARDEFDQSTGNLNGKVLPIGGAWDTDDVTISGSDFTVASGAVAQRTGTGLRFALADASLSTEMTVAVDLKLSALPSNVLLQGVIARYVNSSNYCLAYLQTDSSSSSYTVRLLRTLAGAFSILKNVTVAVPAVSTWYRLTLSLNAGGNYKVWFGPTGGSIDTPLFEGSDSNFATGQPLDDGKVGIYDDCAASGVTRTYDNFAAVDSFNAVEHDLLGISGLFRVYNVEISVDDEGKADVVPTLVEP